MLSGRLTLQWRTPFETTRRVAWKGISRYKTSCLNSRRAWISSRKASRWWQRESKGQRHRQKSGERHRQKFPRRMTRHWHLWIRHWLLWLQPWHQLDPAQVFHRLRRFRQGRQFQHHQHCRRCDLQGIARRGWVKFRWTIPWVWRLRTWSRHLLRWSRRSRDVSELFHPHHVTILWRGPQRFPLWGICRFRGRGNTAGCTPDIYPWAECQRHWNSPGLTTRE